jgi:hypothetical protein
MNVEKCGKRDRREGEFAPEPQPARADDPRGEREWTAVRTCSACAGDYEDPDRTAGMMDEAESEECDETFDTGTEEFPAEDH